jgi:hypothetical protein
MSVAINLLPDVRQARIRNDHMRRLATGIAVAIWIVAAIVVGGLIAGIGTQTLVISNLNSKITSDTSQIEGTSGLSTALTTQQILQSLPGLYTGRSYFSKFMPIIASVMPSTVSITAVSTTPSRELTITGTGSSALAVDEFYQALKNAGQNTAGGNYFSSVLINSVAKDTTTGRTSFTLTATVGPGVTNG